MNSKTLIRAILAFSLAHASVSARAADESPSLLLEKAIYAEETAGELDKAIELYTRIIEKHREQRRSVAKALYRRGLCQEKKKDVLSAAKSFRDLVSGFPEESALVSKARERLAAIAPRVAKLQVDAIRKCKSAMSSVVELVAGGKLKQASAVITGMIDDVRRLQSIAAGTRAEAAVAEGVKGLEELQKALEAGEAVRARDLLARLDALGPGIESLLKGATAPAESSLEIRLVAIEGDKGPATEMIDPSDRDGSAPKIRVLNEVLLGGEHVLSATARKTAGGFGIEIVFTKDGAERMSRVTRENNGRRLAVVVDGALISAATIRSEIHKSAFITGTFTHGEAHAVARAIVPRKAD